jgi:hypothetical protein
MTTRTLPQLVDALIRLAPDAPGTKKLQEDMERVLAEALRQGGVQEIERVVHSIAEYGHALTRLKALPWMWRVELPPPRVLELWFTGRDMPYIAAVSYKVGKPTNDKAQERTARRQAEFYSRYEALTPADLSLTGDDLLIQLVGEFEADINNGGFGQYLGNKGQARAREALAALNTIGAKRTAGWLGKALEVPADADSLTRLDIQINARAEDLASKVMVHLSRGRT